MPYFDQLPQFEQRVLKEAAELFLRRSDFNTKDNRQNDHVDDRKPLRQTSLHKIDKFVIYSYDDISINYNV